jgi:hypothetical protein
MGIERMGLGFTEKLPPEIVLWCDLVRGEGGAAYIEWVCGLEKCRLYQATTEGLQDDLKSHKGLVLWCGVVW